MLHGKSCGQEPGSLPDCVREKGSRVHTATCKAQSQREKRHQQHTAYQLFGKGEQEKAPGSHHHHHRKGCPHPEKKGFYRRQGEASQMCPHQSKNPGTQKQQSETHKKAAQFRQNLLSCPNPPGRQEPGKVMLPSHQYGAVAQSCQHQKHIKNPQGQMLP